MYIGYVLLISLNSIYLLMLYLLKGLQTEWLKTSRTFIVWYVIICPFILAGLMFLVFWLSGLEKMAGVGEKAVDINFWKELIRGGYFSLSNPFLILFIVLLNTMLYAREHQGNMWKHLYALPVPRWSVFGAKSLFAILLLALSLVCFVLFLTLTGYLLDVIKPAYKFASHDNMLGKHSLLAFRIFVSSLGIWAIHNWLSLRFKGFGLSMGIAIISIIVTPFMLLGSAKMKDWVYLYPYLYPYYSAEDFAGKDNLANLWQPEIYGSLLYAIVFTLLGYWEYNRNRHK